MKAIKQAHIDVSREFLKGGGASVKIIQDWLREKLGQNFKVIVIDPEKLPLWSPLNFESEVIRLRKRGLVRYIGRVELPD